MPGIVGIISHAPPQECQQLIGTMVQTMEHESFNLSGAYSAPEIGVYGGWVAQTGSLAAHQPFLNEKKDVVLIFSGECFPEPTIRSRLVQKGHEVGKGAGAWLIHLYEEQGDHFFETLNGLFSGLLIDKRRQRAFLFNDRYGIERIYWFERSDGTYFASEAKALLRVLPETRAFDEEGVAQFLTFGCTVEWRTLFRGIRLLPGGSLWSFENGRCHKGRHFEPALLESQSPLDEAAFDSTFQDTFKKILPQYLEAESKVGISLTGGLDTRMIMACLPQVGLEKPRCYTFTGVSGETLDARLAGDIARSCGLEHQLLRIGSDFFSDFQHHADRTVYVTDGSFGITGAHEIYLNELARQVAPVRLTGVFGSEVLRGMSTFKVMPLSPRLVVPELRNRMESLSQQYVCRRGHPVSFAAFKEIPWNIVGSLTACRSQVSFRTPYLDNAILALAYRCPESLRLSPATAFRCIQKNNSRLSDLPTDMGLAWQSSGLGRLFKRAFAKFTFKLDYLHNEGLPHWLSPLDPLFKRIGLSAGLLGQHKYLHYRSWFRKELAPYLQEVFPNALTSQSPFWNQDFLSRLAAHHLSGRRNYVLELNAVLTLEAVERLLLQKWN
jgi:asparagine synthase (glutamine-hydrolysing)